MVTDDATLPPTTPLTTHDERDAPSAATPVPQVPREIGGPAGLEPTRYGDWERKGRCIDF